MIMLQVGKKMAWSLACLVCAGPPGVEILTLPEYVGRGGITEREITYQQFGG